MIQELLGGGSAPTGLIGDRKISIPFPSHSPSTTPSLTAPNTTTTTSSATTVVNASTNSSNGGNNNSESSTQNLRCPRCDSTNTKFCYYNNYNLTQPRHFCKTCRRYWTKGGTLRNVPIGGGCRKNKSTTSSATSAISGISKSSNAMGKAKATLSTEMLVNGNPGFLGNGLLDHLHHFPELQPGPSPSPSLWPSLPQGQSSHILALLRGATQYQNPSPNPSSISSSFTAFKSEGTANQGLDPYGNGAPSLLGSFSRNNQHQQHNGFGLGGQEIVQNGGGGSNILDLYQRLKSSANYGYCGNDNHGSMILGNMVGSTPSSSGVNSSVLEASSVSGAGDHNLGGYGIMGSAISSWPEFPTVPINGAYP